jgi:hypothetical protein
MFSKKLGLAKNSITAKNFGARKKTSPSFLFIRIYPDK